MRRSAWAFTRASEGARGEGIALRETLDVEQVAVMEGGHVLGVVSRARALSAL